MTPEATTPTATASMPYLAEKHMQATMIAKLSGKPVSWAVMKRSCAFSRLESTIAATLNTRDSIMIWVRRTVKAILGGSKP